LLTPSSSLSRRVSLTFPPEGGSVLLFVRVSPQSTTLLFFPQRSGISPFPFPPADFPFLVSSDPFLFLLRKDTPPFRSSSSVPSPMSYVILISLTALFHHFFFPPYLTRKDQLLPPRHVKCRLLSFPFTSCQLMTLSYL